MCGADVHRSAPIPYSRGSSPRVRSRLVACDCPVGVDGIISACAEQTNTIAARAIGRRDHLRVCGADARESRRLMCWAGSSPRVRSRRLAYHGAKIRIGIISACAEQTFQTAAVRRDRRDHLRVCGADCSAMSANHVPLGSSPRVRSRPATLHSEVAYHGIISACAEQTLLRVFISALSKDHLRVCGADRGVFLIVSFGLGSSPRVRSRHWALRYGEDVVGIISACAEQTSTVTTYGSSGKDHLRVCGADGPSFADEFHRFGSSPRVRSRRLPLAGAAGTAGIISACAEQTWSPTSRTEATTDHLRVCGADQPAGAARIRRRGSSPRVRSRRLAWMKQSIGLRIISACAEQTSARRCTCRRCRDHLRVCGADVENVENVRPG